MSERNVLIAIIVILVIGSGLFGGYIKIKQNIDESLSISPTPVLGESNNETEGSFLGVTKDSVTQSQQKQIKQYKNFPGVLNSDQLSNKKAVIVTSKGKIEFEIFPDAPKAASNFMLLAQNKFYDGLIFHRVVPGFVAQGGDPLGTGKGGPGYSFEDEPVTRSYDKGIVAMANSGPNTNGSQFFIMLEDNPNLPPNYTIFGKVISGQEVVEKIVIGDIMQQIVIQQNTN